MDTRQAGGLAACMIYSFLLSRFIGAGGKGTCKEDCGLSIALALNLAGLSRVLACYHRMSQ